MGIQFDLEQAFPSLARSPRSVGASRPRGAKTESLFISLCLDLVVFVFPLSLSLIVQTMKRL